MSDEPKPTGCLVAFKLNNSDQPPERAMLSSREGNTVYVRAVDPCDPQPPAIRASPGDEGTALKNALAELYVRKVGPADDPLEDGVPLFDGDEVVVLEHISHMSFHTTREDSDGYLFYLRVVPVREVPGTIFMRTLRYGELDDGRRAHWRPGDALTFEDGEPNVHIDHIDGFEGQGVTGYVPLAPVLFTWMSLAAQHHSDAKRRYLLGAARRLDRAHTLFERVGELRRELQLNPPEGAPAVRRAFFDLLGTTELALVALNRAMDMSVKANADIGTTVTVPADITTWRTCVTEIRDAYEHIDERAVGEIRKSPNQSQIALSIFDHERVVTDGVIAYGGYQIDLENVVPDLITATRQYLKDAAAEALSSGNATSAASN
jgi:hypothetical protein